MKSETSFMWLLNKIKNPNFFKFSFLKNSNLKWPENHQNRDYTQRCEFSAVHKADYAIVHLRVQFGGHLSSGECILQVDVRKFALREEHQRRIEESDQPATIADRQPVA